MTPRELVRSCANTDDASGVDICRDTSVVVTAVCPHTPTDARMHGPLYGGRDSGDTIVNDTPV
jgi:hypothetical protein